MPRTFITYLLDYVHEKKKTAIGIGAKLQDAPQNRCSPNRVLKDLPVFLEDWGKTPYLFNIFCCRLYVVVLCIFVLIYSAM